MITHPRKWLPEEIVDVYDCFLFEWRSLTGRLFQKKLYEYPNLEYINFGCGRAAEKKSPHFLNVDFFNSRKKNDLSLDLRFPIPLKSGAWRGIFSHHVLEHLPYARACLFLKECLRLLKDGGVLRIVVPDGGEVMRLYCDIPEKRKSLLKLFPDTGPFTTPMEAVNYIFYGGKFNTHLFTWDHETLGHHLKKAGFRKIVRSSAGKSLDPALSMDVMSWEKFSIYVDAVK